MLEITVWDVQHGSAAYIRTPNNRHIVVDLGDNGEEFSPLRTLYGRGVRQLDAVVITHPHRDHMDDIFNFHWLLPQSLWTPRHLSEAAIRKGNRATDADVVTRYLEIRQQYSGALTTATDLTAQTGFGGATFQFFAPRSCDLGNLNNHSLVVVVSFAGLKMVLPGDNESPSWKDLLLDPGFLAAVQSTDILLAPHHGRVNGWCPELFGAIGNPRLVVISDGRFGDTSATDRYSKQARGWAVFDPSGRQEERNCVTTRCDGHITIKLGWNNGDPSQGNFLNVTTSKVNMSALLAQILGRR
jgi:beta-lactamase superfamily II metal-dependent hydrolase